METLDYGIRYVFTEDYLSKYREYKKGVICNILNGVIVLGKDGEFLFDVDSNLSRRHGKIMDK